MRALMPFFILAIAPFILSCADSNQETIDAKTSLIGTWAFESNAYDLTVNGMNYIDYYTELSDGLINEEAIIDAYELKMDEELVITFRADGTYAASDSEKSYSGTYMLNKSQLLLDGNVSNISSAAVYTLAETKLFISDKSTYAENVFFSSNMTTLYKN